MQLARVVSFSALHQKKYPIYKDPLMKFLTGSIILLASFVANGSAFAQGHWQMMPPSPTARTEVAATQLDGKIYVVGGFTPKGVTDKVEAFDPASGRWSELAPLPQPLHHAAIAAYQNKLYVIGGFSGGMWTPLDSTYAYDPADDKWTQKAPMPSPRGALAVGVINGKIYAVAGARKSFFRLVNSSANEEYDPVTDQWKKRAPIPSPRDHLTVSVVDGILYAIGGRVNVNYNKNLDINEAYDPASDRWIKKSSLPTARSGITSQTLGGKIFVFGGETGGGTFNQNEAYNPKTNRWDTMAPMPLACHGLGSAVIGEKIHLLNGGPKPGGRGSRFHQIFSLKPLREKQQISR